MIIGKEGGWCWVSCNELLEPWYPIHYHILNRVNLFCIDANIWANQQTTKESCQSSSDYQFLAHVQHPIECTCIICETQDNWVQVIIDFAIFKHSKRCAVIQNDGHKFQAVDQDEGLVWIVLKVQKCSLNYFHWKEEAPPNFQSDWIATATKQGTITNDQCCWGSWDQMSHRCLKLDFRVRQQCFWKEV